MGVRIHKLLYRVLAFLFTLQIVRLLGCTSGEAAILASFVARGKLFPQFRFSLLELACSCRCVCSQRISKFPTLLS